MHVDRDRGCCRILFEHNKELGALQKDMESCAEQIDGLMCGGELLREGDHFALCVHRQESLKTYLEREIFDVAAFLSFTRRLRKLLNALRQNGMEIYDGIWDVDCVFVGTGPEDVSFVYIPGVCKQGEDQTFRISDLLAVTSLRVYETDVQALQALSQVIGAFGTWEDTVLLQGDYSEAPFEQAERTLSPFCPNTHPFIAGVQRWIRTLTESSSTASDVSTASELSAVPGRKRKIRIELEGLGMLKGRNLSLNLEKDLTGDGVFTLGRDADQVDFLIPYPIVSRKQASISYGKGEWILTDHGSVNGTFIGDIQIPGESGYPLSQGTCIFFAHKEIGFRVKKV